MAKEVIGTVVWDTELNSTGVEKGLKSTTSKLDGATKSATGLHSAFSKIANAAIFITALHKINQALQDSIKLASDLAEVQNVVDVVFGKNTQTMNAWAEQATQDFGLSLLSAKKFSGTMGAMLSSMGMTSDQVAEFSQKMTGLAGDVASFYNLKHEEAFTKIRSGISGETEPLKQLGINMGVANLQAYALSQGIDKSYESMSQQEKALIRLNYLLSTTKNAQGDFIRTSDGFANQQRLLTINFETLKTKIGDALLPAIRELTVYLGNNLKNAIDFVSQNFTSLQRIAIVTAAVLKSVAGIIAAPFKAVSDFSAGLGYLVGGDWASAQDSFSSGSERIANSFVDAFSTINESAKRDLSNIKDESGNVTDEIVDDAAQAAEAIKKQIKDVNEDYEKSNAKRLKSFRESLADMIWAHQDKVKSIEKQITEENEKYQEKIEETTKSYAESVKKMEDDHSDKLSKIKKNIAEELESEEKKNATLRANAQEDLADEKSTYETKTAELQKQINKEIAKGKNGSQTKIADLKAQILEETAAYRERTVSIQEELDKDLAASQTATQEKLSDLQTQIEEENIAYDEQKAKLIADNEELTQKQLEEHQKQIVNYEASLKEEKDILDAHSSDVASIKDQQREDDISRLKRQYAEESLVAEEEHQKRLKEITTSATTEGNTAGDNYNNALNKKVADNQNNLQQTVQDTISNATLTPAVKAGESAGREFGFSFKKWIDNNLPSLFGSGWLSDVLRFIFPTFSGTGGFFPKFAQGVDNFRGGMAIVGENGPELVNLPSGSDVISSDKTSSLLSNSRPINVNISIGSVDSQARIDELIREIGRRTDVLPT